MGALCFFNAEHGVLISGDALWRNGFGFVMPREIDPAALPATRATLDLLAHLPVRVVIPGHGDPFDDVDDALRRAYTRLESYESDPQRAARHALKVVLMFKLLDCRRLPLEGMPAYVRLQEREFALEEAGYTATKHQREVGAGWFDEIAQAVSGGTSSTLALKGSTEEAQFHRGNGASSH